MSQMTDQQAINEIDMYLPKHCKAALHHIAARLRGEAAQGEQQAVAWTSPEGMERLRTQDDSATVVPEAFRDSRHTIPLYDRPQPVAPVPVAGDAVWSDEAAHAFRCAADAVGAHWHSWPDRFRAGMKAAIAAAPVAPTTK